MGVSQTLRIEQRVLPVFGRATITLGIGQHSSLMMFYCFTVCASVFCGSRKCLVALPVLSTVGSRPSDHYFRSVCLSVCLSICLFVQSFSQPSSIRFRSNSNTWLILHKLECWPMPNVMVALSNIGCALCSTPQSLADAHYYMPCSDCLLYTSDAADE